MENEFQRILFKRRGQDWQAPSRLLALDPGHTTGWAVFENGVLVAQGHSATKDEGWKEIDRLFEDVQPTMVIYENYRVYAHKLERHSNSEVYTLRLIGVMEYLCDVRHKIPRYNQMAQQAKGFATDDKLKRWNMYAKGQRHARDAIRHGIYFLLFDKNIE